MTNHLSAVPDFVPDEWSRSPFEHRGVKSWSCTKECRCPYLFNLEEQRYHFPEPTAQGLVTLCGQDLEEVSDTKAAEILRARSDTFSASSCFVCQIQAAEDACCSLPSPPTLGIPSRIDEMIDVEHALTPDHGLAVLGVHPVTGTRYLYDCDRVEYHLLGDRAAYRGGWAETACGTRLGLTIEDEVVDVLKVKEGIVAGACPVCFQGARMFLTPNGMPPNGLVLKLLEAWETEES